MSGIKRHIAAAVITLMTAAFSCGAIPQRPVPQRLVNDYAGLFPTMQKSTCFFTQLFMMWLIFSSGVCTDREPYLW